MHGDHFYQVSIKWTGNTGDSSYQKSHLIGAQGKPDLLGSAESAFKGDATKWNPEELLLASLSSCHMLWYLRLCFENKIVVTQYSDQPVAVMAEESSGKGYFKEATLHPKVVIAEGTQIAKAEALHEEAQKKCFIANSVNFPINVIPSIEWLHVSPNDGT